MNNFVESPLDSRSQWHLFCQNCGHKFYVDFSKSFEEKLKCPKCQSKKVKPYWDCLDDIIKY